MSDAGDVAERPSITSAFSLCLTLFRNFYFSLAREECKVVNEVSLPKISDGYGRLNVWGANAGAVRSGRGSLDDNLRNEKKLQSIIHDILTELIDVLRSATLLAESENPPENDWEMRDEVSDEDSLSSNSANSDSPFNEAGESHSKKSEIQHLTSIIFEQVRSLYKFSALLRRPAIHEKYIRSIAKDDISYFTKWDQAHVENKFRNANEAIIRRLGLANTRRRQQLNYWKKHHGEEPIDSRAALPLQMPLNKSKLKLISNLGSEEQPAARELIPERLPAQSLGLPSKHTNQSLTTVAISDLNDNATDSGRPRTVYEPSTLGGRCCLRVPDIPKVPFGITTFDCPYCFSKLDMQSMRHRQLWKKHVFRDLRPYVCTSTKCQNPEKLYVTRHDWLYHVSQFHQRRWTCAGTCNLTFPSRLLIEKHMKEQHVNLFKESQLPVLLDMCERPAALEELAECPLCLEEMSLHRLNNHLASHLEELALFILPVEHDGDNKDTGSDQAEMPRENDGRLEEDDLSSLNSFSEGHASENQPTQRAEVFALLREMEEQTSTVQIDGWLRRDVKLDPDAGEEAGKFERDSNQTREAAEHPANTVGHVHGCYLCEDRPWIATCEGWKRHMRDHSTIYPCVLCESSETTTHSRNYTTKSSLRNHLLGSHFIQNASALAQTKSLKRKYFSCGFCISLFDDMSHQLDHIDTEHFRHFQDISEWDTYKVIMGLLLQPEVDRAWQKVKGPGRGDISNVDLSIIENLQIQLEMSEGTAEDLAAAAARHVVFMPSEPIPTEHSPITRQDGGEPSQSSKEAQQIIVPHRHMDGEDALKLGRSEKTRRGKVLQNWKAYYDDDWIISLNDEVVILDVTESWLRVQLKSGKEEVIPAHLVKLIGDS